MTGGAFGSLVAQFFHLTSTERKTLLVSGAAAGMAAIFGTPIAAVLLAVELLLFEWKPRSLVPVALASATAGILRHYILGATPLFPVPPHAAFLSPAGFLGCIVVGLLSGVLALLLTTAVYGSEDLFHRLPIHWMWWPMIGGLVIGIGGFFVPRTLGVGYDTIGAMLQGRLSLGLILAILIVKAIIWSFSLGSGTSGGVVAPLLMMGCALGGILSPLLPYEGAGFWSLIAMAAVMAGAMRAPLTGVVFAVELTHDQNALLPLLIAVAISYTFSVLVMRRSILTEKISRRGYHLSYEYAPDPLEILFAREVMHTDITALSTTLSLKTLTQALSPKSWNQHLYPVLDEGKQVIGIVTRKELQSLVQSERDDDTNISLKSLIRTHPVVAYPDEPLRAIVYRMAETGFTRLPVVEREHPQHLAGIISLQDLLKARVRNLEDERRRERVLHLRTLHSHREEVSVMKQEIDKALVEERES
jgi:CBS domain-containing protein